MEANRVGRIGGVPGQLEHADWSGGEIGGDNDLGNSESPSAMRAVCKAASDSILGSEGRKLRDLPTPAGDGGKSAGIIAPAAEPPPGPTLAADGGRSGPKR
mmetsp:Transcript_86610/g.249905  ORF Transcript_86610/g.249905 Transcript_86610/m.249905 type:complete len:101 (-) Transcript_86610:7-309(-)